MRILDITSRLPYPATDGARIVMGQLVDALARMGHDVTLVALESDGVEERPLGANVATHTVQLRHLPRAVGAAATLLRPHPYTVLKKTRRSAFDLLDRLHAKRRFDLVIADQAHIAHYGLHMKQRHGLPLVLRSHNIEHEIYRRQTDSTANPVLRSYIGLQTRRWQRFERAAIAGCDACLTITDRDAEVVRSIAPHVLVGTLPAVVDTARFPYVDPNEREGHSTIVLGSMNWEPNRLSALWFGNEVWPLIEAASSEAVCHLVGTDPPRESLPVSPRFVIEGRVEDIAPLYSRIAVGLIPVTVGGGMRVKMVEMMASGIPIVSTSIGAEGNLAVPDEHYLRADTPRDFSSAVLRLLAEPELRERLARSAHALAERHYSLATVERILGETLEAVMTSRGATTVGRSA